MYIYIYVYIYELCILKYVEVQVRKNRDFWDPKAGEGIAAKWHDPAGERSSPQALWRPWAMDGIGW